MLCEVTLTLTFDLWPPNSNQLIPERERVFEPDSKKFTQGISKIFAITRMGETRRKPEKQNPFGHIKIRIFIPSFSYLTVVYVLPLPIYLNKGICAINKPFKTQNTVTQTIVRNLCSQHMMAF